MENSLLEFKSKLEESTEHIKINEKIKSEKDYVFPYHLKDTHNFYLCYRTNFHTIVWNNHPRILIELDQEDIEYFKKKYLPKLEEEMNEKINKIKQEYGR